MRVNRLYEDRTGVLWAATDSGLFRLEVRDGRWAFQRVPVTINGLSGRSKALDELLHAIDPLLEDKYGSLWVGTSWGLVRRLPDGRMLHINVHPKRNQDPVGSLVEDSNGRLWIGHAEGLFVFQPEQARAVESIRDTRSFELAEPAAITSLRSTNDLPRRPGEVRWYAGNGSAEPTLYRSRDGSIWCGIGGRLLRFEERSHSVTDIGDWDETQVGSLAEDRHGNLWVAGRTGALKLLVNGFTTFGEKDGLAPSHVHSIFDDSLGHVVVATSRWSVHRFDGLRFQSSRLRIPEDMFAIWASQVVFVDSASQWWALTNGGLFRFRSTQRIDQLIGEPIGHYTRQDGLASDNIHRLFEDARGDIWIGTRSEALGGLSRWDRATGRIHRFLDSGKMAPKEPTAFAEDRSGNLWVGFYDGGLARVRGNDVSLLSDDAGVPPGMITALHVDAADRLWLTTNRSGTARVDDPSAARPRFVTYTTSDGLSSNNVRCITEDRQGRMYFGTVRGVDRLDLTTGRVRQYTMADGLANSFVTSAFRDREGNLWFGTAYGVSRLIPQQDSPQQPPPILINGLRVAGVPHPVSELGEVSLNLSALAPDQNRVQFDFHGLGFAMGERLQYQYKLEGVDADWNPPTEDRSVTYASLAPGSYRFLVRAINADAVASPRPASVTLTILAPIWQRGWFLTMTTALAGLLLAFAYRSRVRHLLALERVRMGIATDLHDDIGANLSQIAILSEVARRQLGPNGSSAIRPLGLIANLSRASVDSMSDIVWATSPEKDRTLNLVTRMRNLANEVLATRDIDFTFDLTGEPQARIDSQLRRQVFLVFKEALNNVVRHSGSRKVEISLRLDHHALVLRITDDGRGFDIESVSNGHGLPNMRARAASLRGHLEVVTNPSSDPSGGTSLILTIPRRRVSFAREWTTQPWK